MTGMTILSVDGKPLNIRDVPKADWLKRIGCLPMTIDVINGGGFSWELINMLNEEDIYDLTSDPKISLLMMIAQGAVELDKDRTAAEYRDTLVEYLRDIEDLPGAISSLLDSVSYIISSSADLARAQAERSMAIRFIRRGRKAKELFRRLVHAALRT